ncbi:voltage-dependent potassium channel, beta subunit [Conidiobolus coronatus NRRL 28638]|uniref:Voltage-dependent potassium channel, beta subunit n=1 Tax=Conidiobolus coronatus (strain ATCC 28846 / CBS 209.66 / NRRL 28638) TaxID=796925 RepID=A0A137NU97_CONC2|nr:voltage-dependent potassium channel, beta subunit [Conidiobolus coronatus NRRL 28638]|eukprot:KXN66298.1 voltage-dependent potassium channel, beta subunit [Conidiobolus coronatus NRRL 28638]
MTQMQYRRLGRSGLKVSVLSFGSWMEPVEPVDQALFDKIIKTCYDNGINFFDNAERYGYGLSEEIFGKAIKNNNLKREDLVISTKIFGGTNGWGPNASGLSKKHLIEGLNSALKRLQLDYVDLVYAHRPDIDVPMEEIVRGFNYLIDQGKAFYWGTSEWSAQQITEAHTVAQRLGLEGPVMEQPEYNLFNREKIEKEYLPIFENFGLGTTIWSPLAFGILTGKYNDGIPEGSRASAKEGWGKMIGERLNTDEGRAKIEKVRKLAPIADKLGCTLAQLSIAWTIKNPNVSTAIFGASKIEQLTDNLKALEIVDKFTHEILEQIDEIVQTKPTPVQNFRG